LELFDPFAEVQFDTQQAVAVEKEDAMDIDDDESSSRRSVSYSSWTYYNWHDGLEGAHRLHHYSSEYDKKEIFKRRNCNDHSLQVTQLYVFLLECYLSSPMRGPLIDPVVSADYMNRLVDQMAVAPNCWTWDCLPAEQRTLYKNFDIKLTNPFNLIGTDDDWTSIVQNSPASSTLYRTHHYVHHLQLTTAQRMVEFFFNFIPTSEQSTIDKHHFPMFENFTTLWSSHFGTYDTTIKTWLNALWRAGNMVFVSQFIRTLGTAAAHFVSDNISKEYICDFPLNLRSFKHGEASTAVYPSHYFPYDSNEVFNITNTKSDVATSPAVISEIMIRGTISMIKNHGYASITLDSKDARMDMQPPVLTFDQYLAHVRNVQRVFFNLVKPLYTINYSQRTLERLQSSTLTANTRDNILFKLSGFNVEDEITIPAGDKYLASMEILPYYWLHNFHWGQPSAEQIFSTTNLPDDGMSCMTTLLFHMIENGQLEMIVWMARQLLMVTTSPTIAQTYKYRNISFAYAQITFFYNLVSAIRRIRSRSIVTYLQWVRVWVFDLFVANIQETMYFDSVHDKIFGQFPCFGILANQPFAVWLALAWIGPYQNISASAGRGIMYTMPRETWKDLMKMFFVQLIVSPSETDSYGWENSVHSIELFHYLRETLQLHTILPLTRDETRAGFDGVELSIDRLSNPNKLKIFKSGRVTLPQACYHGVMAAINADLYNTILYRNAPGGSPKAPLTPWALEFFQWSNPVNRTLIDFTFSSVDGFNANSVMTNSVHLKKIRDRLVVHSDRARIDETETLSPLAAIFSLTAVMAKWNLEMPKHLSMLYMDPLQRARYSTLDTTVPNSLFEFLFVAAFPGCSSLDAMMMPAMVKFSALTEPSTFISNIVNGQINLHIASNCPQSITLLIVAAKLKTALVLWSNLAVRTAQMWMVLSQLFAHKDHTTTRVMDCPTETRHYFKSSTFKFAKCWRNPLEDDDDKSQLTSMGQLAFLRTFMLLPNNLLHFFGELKTTHREEAIARLLRTNPYPVATPTALRETLGRFFIWMHLTAYGKIVDFRGHNSTSLVGWASFGSGPVLLNWIHTTYCAPTVKSISELVEYNRPALTTDNIAELERHNRNCYSRSFIDSNHHTPLESKMYDALAYGNYELFLFFRTNYQLHFKSKDFFYQVTSNINYPNPGFYRTMFKIQAQQYIKHQNIRMPRHRINQLNIPPNCGPQPVFTASPQEYKKQLLNFTRTRTLYNKRLAAADTDTVVITDWTSKKQAVSLKRKLQLLACMEDAIEDQENVKRSRSEEEEEEEEEESRDGSASADDDGMEMSQ